MLPTNLDLDTVRTLVLAADLGSYSRAAGRLGRTPSAVSLQMKRLQESLGTTLFRKHGRKVVLTEAGEIALRFGRRMRVLNDELLDTVRGASLVGSARLGCSQDFADTVLPRVLSQFTKLYPLVQLELHIEGNGVLVEGVGKGTLDVALAVGQEDQPTAEELRTADIRVECIFKESPIKNPNGLTFLKRHLEEKLFGQVQSEDDGTAN